MRKGKIAAAFLTVMLMIMTGVMGVCAENSDIRDYNGYLRYRTVDEDGDGVSDSAEICLCRKNTVTAQVPQNINGLPVRRIANGAFRDCLLLREAVLPDSVETIEQAAFYNCVSLEKITMNGVEFIGDSAFSRCGSLERIRLPQTLVSIGENAFGYCDWLLQADIPQNTKEIRDSAFYRCDSLSDVIIRNPQCSIASTAFDFCDNAALHGYQGSTAQEYAGKNALIFMLIDETAVRGDISGNGSLDLQDVILVAKSLLGKVVFEDGADKIADFNDDGKVDLQDAIAMAACLLDN